MTVAVDLPYGEKTISMKLPEENLFFIAKPSDLPGVADEAKEIRRAIKNPIACPKLSDLLKPGHKVVIVADDHTRLTPCKKILPILLDELNAVGVRDEDMKVIIALGTHRPMNKDEILNRFGKKVLERVPVINHTPKDEKNLQFIGKLASGTLVWINKEVYEADFKISLGNVIPHCYGGWAAGAKTILPGVSSDITTGMTHLAGARLTTEKLIGDPNNPLRREMEEVAKEVRLNMIVNTVLNSRRQIVKVFAGDVVKAHREAVKAAEKIYCCEVPAEADIVIVSSHPADIDYFQAIKGFIAAYGAVKKGGTMILLTPCPEGISPTHPIIGEYGTLTFKELDQMVREKKTLDLVGVACLMIQSRLREKANLILVSEYLTEKICERLGAQKVGSPKKALDLALKRYEDQPKIGVLTHSELIPIVKKP